MNIKSKEKLQKFLSKNIPEYDAGKYASFTNIKGDTELVYFSRYDMTDKPFFPPSPCPSYEYDCTQWDDDDREGYIIKGNKAYDIASWQVMGDYLPNNLNDFKLITEDEALDILLKK